MTNSNYTAAWLSDFGKKVTVFERDLKTGERIITKWDTPYYFYVPDEDGERETIFGDKVTRLTFKNKFEFTEAAAACSTKFESDISPVDRVLMDNYYGRPTPPVNFAFIDIETDYTSKKGFAGPKNPYAPINAVTIYQSWTKKFLTYVLPPPGFELSNEEFQKLLKEYAVGFKLELELNVVICDDECDLIAFMLDAIQDADIVSGWNSEFYDLPYIFERIVAVLGPQALQSLELPGCRPPEKREVNKFGSLEPVIKLSGRTHLDYLRLFEKFTFEGRSSYSLANIANEELDVPKLEYDGTLEELYTGTYRPNIDGMTFDKLCETDWTDNELGRLNVVREMARQEFQKENQQFETNEGFKRLNAECIAHSFCLFTAYNIRDVEVIVKLDEKFKFIALVNQMAHESTTDFSSIMGTVKYVETAITNHAHYKLNKVVHDKFIIPSVEKAEGAIVMTPKIGLHEWLGSVDINSLYPNVIRSLNMSPEKIVGQFTDTKDERDWLEIYKNTNEKCTFIWNNGEKETRTAAEWKELLLERKWAISGYGTVFDQSNGHGVVPDILGYWYDSRKEMQAEKKKWQKEGRVLRETLGFKVPDEL